MSTLLIFFSKLIVLPLYPVGFCIVSAVAGLAVGSLTRFKRTALFLIVLSPTVLVFFATPVLVRPLVVSLESKYPPRRTFPKASAIVLLGGSSEPALPPRLRPEINDAGDRILYAGILLRDSAAPYLITNGRCPTCTDPDRDAEATVDASLLTEIFRFDSTRIIREDRARNTHEHGVNLDSLFQARKMAKSIILVTSAAHMARSVAVFRKHGFTVYPAPTDYHHTTAPNHNLMDYFPSSSTLETATSMLHEIYGTWGYRILGWI